MGIENGLKQKKTDFLCNYCNDVDLDFELELSLLMELIRAYLG